MNETNGNNGQHGRNADILSYRNDMDIIIII